MADTRTGAERTDERRLEMWVVYENPLDYPGKFVCRRWVVTPEGNTPDGHCWVTSTLEDARSKVPPDCFRIPHQDGEDPCIVETWL